MPSGVSDSDCAQRSDESRGLHGPRLRADLERCAHLDNGAGPVPGQRQSCAQTIFHLIRHTRMLARRKDSTCPSRPLVCYVQRETRLDKLRNCWPSITKMKQSIVLTLVAMFSNGCYIDYLPGRVGRAN